jgi:hypothetical protein
MREEVVITSFKAMLRKSPSGSEGNDKPNSGYAISGRASKRTPPNHNSYTILLSYFAQ